MSILLGIDIGTSSTKALLLDSENGVIDVASQGYEVIVPQMGYAEQNPGKWWNAVCDTLGKLKSDHQAAFKKIAAVGLSGQMHGLVAVNANGKPVRPAIIWLDQRSNRQVEEIKKLLSEDEIKRICLLYTSVYDRTQKQNRYSHRAGCAVRGAGDPDGFVCHVAQHSERTASDVHKRISCMRHDNGHHPGMY